MTTLKAAVATTSTLAVASRGLRVPSATLLVRAARVAALLGLVLSFGAMVQLYTQVPDPFPQPPFWSPRAGHAAQVAELYRAAAGLPRLPLTVGEFARAHQALLGASLLSWLAVLALAPGGLPPRTIWVTGGVLAGSAVLMPPLYSTDVFYYGISGEVVARFGANPHVATPSSFPDSRLLPFNYWDIPSPYGPAWTSVSALLASAGAFDPLATTLVFKLLGAAAVLGTGWLLARHQGPSGSTAPLALVLLNPVVWLEAVANAHLDALMLALIAAAVVAQARRRPRLAWWCLLLGMWVKYLVAPLLGLHVVSRLRREIGGLPARARLVGILALDAVVLSLAVWLPYWEGPATLASLAAESGRGFSSPVSLLVAGLAARLGLAQPEATMLLGWALALGALALLGLWLCLLLWLWRRPNGPTLDDEVCAAGVLLLVLPLVLPRSHPWYLLVPVILLAFGWRRAPRLALVAHGLAAIWVFVRYAPV